MTDADKLQAVRTYFHEQFPAPAHHVSDTYDASGLCQLFRVDRGSELLHRIVVAEDFLEAHGADTIAAALDESRVLEMLERAGTARVLITRRGPRIDEKD
jgi:hypothetical protein